MPINHDVFQKLIEKMDEDDKKTVYDFMLFLIEKRRKTWEEIKAGEPDDEPLTEDELNQLHESDGEYVTWEEAKDKLGL